MDLGKVTVFSGSPQQQSSSTLPTSLYLLQLVLQLDDMAECSLLLNFRENLGGAALLALK